MVDDDSGDYSSLTREEYLKQARNLTFETFITSEEKSKFLNACYANSAMQAIYLLIYYDGRNIHEIKGKTMNLLLKILSGDIPHNVYYIINHINKLVKQSMPAIKIGEQDSSMSIVIHIMDAINEENMTISPDFKRITYQFKYYDGQNHTYDGELDYLNYVNNSTMNIPLHEYAKNYNGNVKKITDLDCITKYMNENYGHKAFNVSEIPKIIVVDLLRSIIKRGSIKLEKDQTIVIPSKIIEIEVDDDMYKYKLFALISHTGTQTTGGHYTCYCLYGNQWILKDDGSARNVSFSEIQKKGSTFSALFYTMVDLTYEPVEEPSITEPNNRKSTFKPPSQPSIPPSIKTTTTTIKTKPELINQPKSNINRNNIKAREQETNKSNLKAANQPQPILNWKLNSDILPNINELIRDLNEIRNDRKNARMYLKNNVILPSIFYQRDASRRHRLFIIKNKFRKNRKQII